VNSKHIIATMALCIAVLLASAQQQADTIIAKKAKPIPVVRDSAYIVDSVRRAEKRRVTRHSAFVPGWGQINNKQGWKVPIIYGALGVTTYIFFYNLEEYKALRQAYIYRTDTIPGNDNDIPEKYRPLSNNSIQFYRDEYRQNVDLSALAFLIIWGLNVVDATVFAHLRDFDVSDDIGLRLKAPNINPINGYTQVGISLHKKSNPPKLKPLPTR
jgi:hypothetical protein